MELNQVLRTRRSVRQYTDQPLERHQLAGLIDAAIQAPSASNSQPWAFAVIQDREQLKQYSDRAKTHLLSIMEQQPAVAKYRDMLANPDYNLFYNAHTLVIIFAKPQGLHPQGDCCLAAQNFMLAAHEQGLGTCWIGFALTFLNLPETKAEQGVPADYSVVAPIIVGYPQGSIPQLSRQDPQILFWR